MVHRPLIHKRGRRDSFTQFKRGGKVGFEDMDDLHTLPTGGAEPILQPLRSTALSLATAPSLSTASSLAAEQIPSAEVSTGAQAGLRVAYLASRFPKITETFILYEMRAVEDLGVMIELYPLRRERTKVMHEDARTYLERAHFVNLLSPRVVAASFYMVLRRPKIYLRAVVDGVRANWGSPRLLLGFLASFPKAVVFARDIEQRGVQHIHAHFASHPAAAAWLIHRLTGIPYSFTAHGSDLHRDQHMLQEKVAEAAMVVTISKYNRRLILKHCGTKCERKVRVIHCGTDTEAFRPGLYDPAADCAASLDSAPLDSAANPRPSPVLQIACIGTLHEVKGQAHLIRACRIMQNRGFRFQLHLIGDGPDEAMLRTEAARCEIGAAVLFHGRCTRPRLVTLLSQMDVVVAPSVPTRDGRREGIPVALMEAMSAGVAVIASALSGIPELVQHRTTGLLVPPGNPAAIAAAIEELASDPEQRQRLSAAARRSVQVDFDQRRCAEQLVEAIRRLHEPQSVRPKLHRAPVPWGLQP